LTLVFDKRFEGPGTHAIVIGIGDYPFSPGIQITSPPASARAMAEWLLTAYDNPARKLQTLDLLISDRDSSDFTMPDGKRLTIDRASTDTVVDAVKLWRDRGDGNHGKSLMLFYFCGHGISKGPQTTLLMDDFGREPRDLLQQAIDFNGFYLGMDKCEARYQCFFIDACRAVSSLLLEAYDYNGLKITYGRTSVSPNRRAPIYYATLAGAAAHARPGSASYFTAALLKALEGAGSEEVNGEWWIRTDVLNRAIDYLLRRNYARTASSSQVMVVDHLTPFSLHRIGRRPIVPVDVGCLPQQRNRDAILAVAGEGIEARRDSPSPAYWDVDLQEGDYRFSAKLTAPNVAEGSVHKYVLPPFREIRIQVP
jgi:hypothetical protein